MPRFTLSHCTIALTILLVWMPFTIGASAQIADDLELSSITSISGRAVAVRNAGDGSNRLFIVQQSGLIWIYDIDTATQEPVPFLNIETLVDDSGNEQGLLGLAFHPNYTTNGFFYVNYTRDPGAGLDRTVVARYSVSAGDPDLADPGSAAALLEIEQHSSNHNGGDIHFGPDGFLYIGMGDGGGADDTGNYSQNPQSLLGKMLRIDVDGGGGSTDCGLVENYTVPASNPFVGDSSTCDEIWHIGLRNPWRFSFDRLNGDLFIGDVGQNDVEEIDYLPASSTGGENWGWRCYEGSIEFDITGCGPIGDYDFPILEYTHSGANCSVTGGFRYRGSQIAGFNGIYVYADYCSGNIWFADETGGWSASLWSGSVSLPATFGEDEAGELYIGTLGGAIYRFNSPSTIFLEGFESGDISAWTSSTP